MSDEETLAGARGRVQNVREAVPGADYYAGLEGGCALRGEELGCFAWIAVCSLDGREGIGRTGEFFLPPVVAALVRGGMELGPANDKVFATHNSKQHGGAVGLLTNGVVPRKDYYEQTVLLALIPFLNPDMYPAK
jgi:inosine/xanthosine triphosphatase